MFITEEELLRRLNSDKNISAISAPSLATPAPITDTNKDTDKDNENKSLDSLAKAATIQSKTKALIKDNRTRQESNDHICEMALDMMVQSLARMTDDKLENASLKDLSAISANMARVVEKLSPKEAHENVQIVIYAPAQNKVTDYETIDVG